MLDKWFPLISFFISRLESFSSHFSIWRSFVVVCAYVTHVLIFVVVVLWFVFFIWRSFLISMRSFFASSFCCFLERTPINRIAIATINRIAITTMKRIAITTTERIAIATINRIAIATINRTAIATINRTAIATINRTPPPLYACRSLPPGNSPSPSASYV